MTVADAASPATPTAPHRHYHPTATATGITPTDPGGGLETLENDRCVVTGDGTVVWAKMT